MFERISYNSRWWFYLLVLSIVGSTFLFFLSREYYILLIPIIVFGLFITLVDFKQVYFLLYACIPISVAMEVGGGFSTDLPSEPIMLVLSAVTIVFVLSKPTRIGQVIKHPITLLLLLHLGWILISALNSTEQFISWKFVLAKTWYLLPCYFLTSLLINKEEGIYRICRYALIPTVIVVLINLSRHALEGFSFRSVNFVMGPFFINHVMYAALIVTILPMIFIWFRNKGFLIHPLSSWRKLAAWGIIILLAVGVVHSYTRAAMIALLIALAVIPIIRFKLMKHALVLGIVVVVLLGGFLIQSNQYLTYAPEYTKTISHHRFDNLIKATTQGEDVSTMERAHRWIAGFRMIQERPVVGFGPGSFYPQYQPYTISSFQTYVSNNPDRSGIHNYFLMVFVEQGIIGGLIFLIFSMYILIRSENLYHAIEDANIKWIVLALALSLVIINALILINDLLETDKIGCFYYTFVAILVSIDIRYHSTLSIGASNKVHRT